MSTRLPQAASALRPSSGGTAKQQTPPQWAGKGGPGWEGPPSHKAYGLHLDLTFLSEHPHIPSISPDPDPLPPSPSGPSHLVSHLQLAHSPARTRGTELHTSEEPLLASIPTALCPAPEASAGPNTPSAYTALYCDRGAF